MAPCISLRWVIGVALALGLHGATRARAETAATTTASYAPVCSNGEYLGDNGLGTPGQDWETRHIYFCPQGAKVIQLMFAGSYADGSPPVEHNMTDPQVIDLSVETYVPPVWSPTTAYVAGDQVSGPVASNNGGGTYQAVAASTGNLPTASNTGKWKVTTAHPIPITCNGVRPCVLGTHIDGTGHTVTNAFLVTDPLAVDIPPNTLIAIRGFIQQSGSQVMANGPSQSPRAGTYQLHGQPLADVTLSGSRVPGGPDHNTGPFAIVGLQNVAKPVPSVCILGDSRIEGVSGLGMTYAPIYNGGSGYIADDIGRLVRNVDTGGTPDSAVEPIVYVIQNVAGGKVTAAGVYYAGHYAIAMSNANPGIASAPPVGPQPTHAIYGTTGSGLVIDIPASGGMSGAAGLYEDPRTFAQGFVQKGLSDGNIPFASFSRSSDRVSIWASPGGDTNRLAAIRKTGCSNVIMGYGIKDLNAGEGVAQIEAEFVTVANQILALGTVKAIFLATIPPQTSSTDHWTTVAGQTPIGFEQNRLALNAWERAVPAPYTGMFDPAAHVEVNRLNVPTLNGGFWIVNGSPHYPTTDATHLAPAAAVLAAASITPYVRFLRQ